MISASLATARYLDSYDSDQFEQALGRHARIVQRLELAPGGRTLYEFERLAVSDDAVRDDDWILLHRC